MVYRTGTLHALVLARYVVCCERDDERILLIIRLRRLGGKMGGLPLNGRGV